MFKKLIAGVASVALALGMVALTASPASAHTPTVTPSCTGVSVNLTNYSNGDTNHLEVWLDGTKVADVADFNTGFAATYNFTQVLATHTYEVKIDVSGGTQYDYNVGQKTIGDCLPDDTSKKVELCHWDEGQGGKYTYNNVSVSSVINVPNGHIFHPQDIIPPFSYIKQGVAGSFAGLNWTVYNQLYWANDCKNPEVEATDPSYTDAVCTGVGQVGQGSYTIPVTAGVQYWQKFTSGGTYVVVAAGTYPLSAGDDVYIKATALAGYQLDGNDNQNSWHHEISGPTASKCVVPAAATSSPSVCIPTAPGQQSGATYTIPTSNGIQYQKWNGSIWVNINPGTYPLTGQVKIQAVKTGSFIIVPGSTVEWTFDYVSAGDCLTTVEPTAPSFGDGFCYMPGLAFSGSYTIPAAKAGTKYQVKFAAGDAWVDKPAGSYPLVVGDDVYIQAVALTGYALTGTTSWYDVAGGPVSENCVAVAAPSVTPAVCTGPGTASQASYTIPVSTGIQYQVWNGVTWVNVGSGTENVNSFPTSIPWQAVAIAPYVIAPGSTTSGTLLLESAGACLKPVTAIADIDQAVCTGEGTGVILDGSYTISTSEGVYYKVALNGGSPAVTAAGTYTVPTGTLIAITAHEEPGYTITGTTSWSDTIDVPENCLKVEGDPTFHEGCDVQTNTWSSPNFNVIAADHVYYTWSLNGTEQLGTLAVGNHTANPGDVVVITAHADPGYELNENPWVWSHTFGNPTEKCSLTPPVLSCLLVVEGGLLPLGALEHADWVVDGVNVGGGAQNVQLSTTNVTISVVAHTGYAFSGVPTSWTFDLDANNECDLPTDPDWPTSVTHTDQICRSGVKGGSTVTVGQFPGDVSFFDEVNYYLDGSVTPMATSTVAVAPGEHTVTASAKDPDDGIDGEDSWTFTVLAAPGTCDLTTLALTGTNPIGWAGIGYYLLVTGLALIAVRTVRRRNEAKQ